MRGQPVDRLQQEQECTANLWWHLLRNLTNFRQNPTGRIWWPAGLGAPCVERWEINHRKRLEVLGIEELLAAARTRLQLRQASLERQPADGVLQRVLPFNP
eukprot:7388465-Prymnesium_polylepis.1